MYIKDKIQISGRKFTDEGFLEISSAKIARSGIQEYTPMDLGMIDVDPQLVIRVFRPPDEVFKDSSMQSFANKPVTNNHPSELVSSKNVKALQVGFSGDKTERNGIFLEAKLIITDAEMIKDIESGKSQLSNGYTSEIDFKDGITDEGEHYDAIQSNIKGNHIAIVDKARCGPECRIQDHQNIGTNLNQDKFKPFSEDEIKRILKEGKKMLTIVIDGVTYEVTEQVKQVVEKIKDNLEKANTVIEDQKTAIDTSKAEIETLKTDHKKEIDKLQAKLDDALERVPDAKMLDAIVERRLTVITTAKKVIKDYDSTGKTCDEMRAEVVKHVHPDLDIENKSVDYIQARFDSINDFSDKKESDPLTRDLQNYSQDTDINDSQKSRMEAIKRAKDAWKKPVKSVL